VIEPALPRHGGIERALPGMAEGGVAEIVRKGEGFGQILVEAKRAGERAGDLRHLEAMGEARAVVVALVIDKHLGLVVQPAEGSRMQDTVAVAGERRAGRARRFIVKTAAALQRIGGIRRQPRQGRAFPFTLTAVVD
jgi:hypothetical protein